VELTSAETAAFATGYNDYQFDVQATLTNGDVVTLVWGTMSVIPDVR
jgi:hypothetical protein